MSPNRNFLLLLVAFFAFCAFSAFFWTFVIAVPDRVYVGLILTGVMMQGIMGQLVRAKDEP